MNRRHFLQLTGASIFATMLPNMSFAREAIFYVPDELRSNPILQFNDLPNYPAIKPHHIEPAIKFIMEESKRITEELCKQANPTWKNFYQPLEELQAYRSFSWSIVSDLDALADSDQIRQAYDDARKHRSAFNSWYGMNEEVYACFKRLKSSPEYRRYNAAQKKAIDNQIRDFERSGVGLSVDDKARLAQIEDRLSKVRSQFSNNVIDANKWAMTITDSALVAGIPQSILEVAQNSAKEAGEDGYRFMLTTANAFAIFENADNRELREKFYRAYETRASDMADDVGKYDNYANMNEILALQYERAKILGYKNYAHYALENRMAKTPREVMGFYQGMIAKVRGIAKAQMDELISYGKEKLGISDPQMWDFHYIANKRKTDLYDFDQEEMRSYFPIAKVLSGVFEVNRRLFGVTIKEKMGVPAWHETVRFFELFNEKGEHIGSTYVDLYAREGKQGGAWKSNIISRRKDASGKIIKPVTVLVCNFTPPSDGVALLSQDDVLTLFHEFGHVMHEIITKVDVSAVAGTKVPRDAVEFPSQFMEYYAWEEEVMPLFSGHYQTGEALPKELIQKANATKNYMMARSTMRQIEYGLIDLRLYNEYNPNEPDFINRIHQEIQQNVSVVREPSYVRSLNSFSHIFTGGYAAGYYGYLWSDVLSADVFSHFEKVGIFNKKVSRAYVDKFLSKGGSEDVMDMYVDFMGRKPKPDALMKRLTDGE
ncbi:MAG: M3 family metallopeptidase [Moraxella sp.]|nr:M3 family metallopeptidase [Moraxella sp.]